MISLDNRICSDFDSSSSREWLETNGIGGYASATVSGANSRRYHGLLVAATRPPLGRMVLLSKFEEALIIDGEQFEISCNRYPGSIHPEGYKFITGFRLDPFPVWTFSVAGIEIEKKLFMLNGENTAVIQWSVKNDRKGGSSLALELKPLLAFRDHHHLRHEDVDFDGEYQVSSGLVSIQPYAEMPRLFIANNATGIEAAGYWYRNFEYAIEQERGFDFSEDLFQPFSLRFDLSGPATVIASTDPKDVDEAAASEAAEIERRMVLVQAAGSDDELISQLVLAADQFIVSRGTGKTVIAGYHWFSDWGRDTMIALNGLTLATNRPDVAKNILLEFSNHISEGMIPNRFPDAGEVPEYNTVDATLWYFEAIRAYAEHTGDYEFVRDELYEKLVNIIDWHIQGTRYGIRVDTDGLLRAGEPGVQLTWMDAKIGDWVVTPRSGKAVEIQALWYNALCIMGQFAERFNDSDEQPKYFEMAEIARDSFNGQFWNEQEGCLYDVIDGDERDGSVRPNQIFAVGLKHSMLDIETSKKIVDKVESELMTPVGLRSLSPSDPRYVGRYIGSPYDRDASYHQGTAWGWLIGGFVDAYIRVHSDEANVQRRLESIIKGFKAHLTDSMVGQVAEIFDGDAPHAARGCGAQAWSVAELLRVTIAAKMK